MKWLGPLHTGSFGGLDVKVLWWDRASAGVRAWQLPGK